jgi:L-alanine-DL-glutamate epimerase-like enolase superfamily enzyme
LITEYFVNFEAVGREIAKNAFEVHDSYIELPTGPGLGIELDEAALGRRPVGERKPRRMRQYTDE